MFFPFVKLMSLYCKLSLDFLFTFDRIFINFKKDMGYPGSFYLPSFVRFSFCKINCLSIKLN